MARNRKVLRVGTPIPLTRLRKLLEAVDDPDATVRHQSGELVVEIPEPTLAFDGNLELHADVANVKIQDNTA